MKRRSRSGFSLAFSLMLLAILFLLGLTLGMVGINNMSVIQAGARTQSALQAADAGIEQIRSLIESNQSYGTLLESFEGTMAGSGIRYWGSFGSGALQSVNNLNSGMPFTRSDGSIVPPYCADIIVNAKVSGGSNTRVVAVGLLMTNRWDFAVASSGDFDSSGGLEIRGASDLDHALLVVNGDEGDQPGNLVANSNENPSVKMRGSPIVTGTIYTPGVVSPSSLTNVDHSSVPIPNITWTFYTPSNTSAAYYQLTNASYSNLSLPESAGRTEVERKGSLIVSGGLVLDNCILSVDGNLSVSGGLRMTNSKIYVNGNISVSGGIKDASNKASSTGSIFICGANHTFDLSGSADLEASNTTGMAIYSQGKISLSGGAHIQGVVYSHGDIEAKGGARIIGIVIANGNTQTSLDFTGGARIIYTPVFNMALTSMTSSMKLRKLCWRIVQ
jgi:cytoskeletal protein CcmA (bactofilin family)